MFLDKYCELKKCKLKSKTTVLKKVLKYIKLLDEL